MKKMRLGLAAFCKRLHFQDRFCGGCWLGSGEHTHDVVPCSFAVDIFFDNSWKERGSKNILGPPTSIESRQLRVESIYVVYIYPIYPNLDCKYSSHPFVSRCAALP